MPDPCQISLDWLEEFAQHWFTENVSNHGQLWFSDENVRGITKNFPNPHLPVEVILTGSFFARILESTFWNFDKFRLWTFSPAIKSFLTSILNIDPAKIGVIGRPCYQTPLFVPDFTQEVNLIYAGRLSLSKNISALLRVVSLLQTKHNKKVTLDIFGEFDSFPDESLGKYQIPSLDELILKNFNELPWCEAPTFHGHVPAKDWINIKRLHPTFISLSTSMYEDFGTATQMAASRGWPSILSSWGGHKSAQNSILIPSYLIPQEAEPTFIQNAKSQEMAKKLSSNTFEFFTNQKDSNFIPQSYFERESFQQLIHYFIKNNSPEILFCFREKMTEFADTAKGVSLFKEYRKCFAGDSTAHTAIVYDDSCNAPVIEGLTLPRETYELIAVRQLFSSFYLKELPSFKEIIFLNLNEEMTLRVSDFLTSTLSLNTPLFIQHKGEYRSYHK